MADQDALSLGSEDGTQLNAVRKVRIHKMRRAPAVSAEQASKDDATRDAAIDRRIAELIPGIADLSVSESAQAGPLRTAASVREKVQSRQQALNAELEELHTIYDMDRPHPVDTPQLDPSKPWSQSLRPPPKRVVLSHYQAEMINYQRMLLRKNIWYYRDRMNVARGPCPVHTLKEAWVQGVIDENTLVWGQGLYDWLPAKNIKLLLPLVRTPEVRLGAWIKRTFSLKPALNRVREQRKDQRDPTTFSKQVERMR